MRERELHTLFESQLGLVTRAQAHDHDVTDRMIAGRLGSGAWVRVHPGVYRLAGSGSTPHQRALAACLAAGPTALTSHRSAAELLGLMSYDGEVAITVPATHRPRLRGVRVYRSRNIARHDRGRSGPVPITSATRTVMDLASVLAPEPLEDLLDDAVRRGMCDIARLRSRADKLSGVAGLGVLRSLLDARVDGVPTTRLETRMLRLLRAWRLPAPVLQLEKRLGGRRRLLDFAWPDERVALETDGGVHLRARVRRDDYYRQNEIQLAGWRIVRFVWADIDECPELIVMTVARALDLQAARWRKRPQRARVRR